MKKGLIILFLGLLMYNTIGFVINFHCVLAEWRQEMRLFLSQNIPESDLVQFKFKKTAFDISTDEFSKDGKRYDVLKTKLSGDDIIVYCFQDDTETALMAQFNDFLFQNSTSKGDFQRKMSSIFKHLRMEYVFESPFSIQWPPSVFLHKKSVLSYQNRFFATSDFDILTPPPQYLG